MYFSSFDFGNEKTYATLILLPFLLEKFSILSSAQAKQPISFITIKENPVCKIKFEI